MQIWKDAELHPFPENKQTKNCWFCRGKRANTMVDRYLIMTNNIVSVYTL